MTAAACDRVVAVVGALTVHAGLLFTGGLAQPAEYGIESGSGGMEVLLMAALPEAGRERRDQQPQDRQSVPPAVSSSENAFALFEPVPADPRPEPEAVSRASLNDAMNSTPFVGDGSSATPGTNPITFYSEGGGQTTSRPGHLRNPAPPYPMKARQLSQEGVVTLVVRIDASGHPTSVDLEQSSGFPLLDDSALKTVRRWRFRPARIGGMTVESVVEVPIRFVLRNT